MNRFGEKGVAMIKKEYTKICKRFDDVMNFIGCEHLMLSEGKGEVYDDRRYYDVQNGITLQWMEMKFHTGSAATTNLGTAVATTSMTARKVTRSGLQKPDA